MPHAKTPATGAPRSPSQADSLDEIKKAVRADRKKIASVPVANLELKRSALTLGRL